jgi:regulatory protein YycI of two-component signal transduction system YycFG
MNNKLIKNILFITLALIVFIILPFIYIKTIAQSQSPTNEQCSTNQIQAEDGSCVSESFYSNQSTYTITQASNNEYHAQSTTDQTGLFFTQSDLINVNQSNLNLSIGDSITVSFDDYETISSIQLINK